MVKFASKACKSLYIYITGEGVARGTKLCMLRSQKIFANGQQYYSNIHKQTLYAKNKL
jgi:hypothetical protein